MAGGHVSRGARIGLASVLLALAILAWIALCLGVQFLVTWWAGRRT